MTQEKRTTGYEGWIEDLAHELAGEYATHGDGEPRAHSVLEDAVLEQLAPKAASQSESAGDGPRAAAGVPGGVPGGVPAYVWEDPDPAGRTRVLLYALYESLWPWGRSDGCA